MRGSQLGVILSPTVYLETFSGCHPRKGLLAFSVKRTRMSVNILQCTGMYRTIPKAKHYSVQSFNRAEMGKSCFRISASNDFGSAEDRCFKYVNRLIIIDNNK